MLHMFVLFILQFYLLLGDVKLCGDHHYVLSLEMMPLDAIIKQSSRISNVNCSFDLVPSQYPELDARGTDKLYGIFHLVLQFILDCRGSYQLHVYLDRGIYFVNLLLALFHQAFCLGSTSNKAFILFFGDGFPRQ